MLAFLLVSCAGTNKKPHATQKPLKSAVSTFAQALGTALMADESVIVRYTERSGKVIGLLADVT